jgi:hypothetical protein
VGAKNGTNGTKRVTPTFEDDETKPTGGLHGYSEEKGVVHYEIHSFLGFVQVVDLSKARGGRVLQRLFTPTVMPSPGDSKALLVSKELQKLGTTTPTSRSGTLYEGQGTSSDPVPTRVTRKVKLLGFSKSELAEIYKLTTTTAAARGTRIGRDLARSLVLAASREAKRKKRDMAAEMLRGDETGHWEHRAAELHEAGLRSARYEPRKVDRAIINRLALEAIEMSQAYEAMRARSLRF